MRVLLVIKCLGFGGAERLVVDTVSTGDHTTFEYEVAYILAAENALVPELTDRGIAVHCLGGDQHWDLAWMARLRRLVVEGRFDVVHFHLPYTAALGRLVVASIPKDRRPSIVYTEHSPWNRMALLLRALNRVGIGLDRQLIVISQAGYEALPPGLRGRARVIVHGVDLGRSAALFEQRDRVAKEVRHELGVPDGTLLVLTVANFRPEKAYDVLLETARLMADHQAPVRFLAVGRGPLEAELTEQHRRLDLVGSFTFLGPRDDVLRLMVASDLFVLASRQEGLPVVLMEATAVGMPIVATAVGAVPLVLTDRVDGLVVSSEDPGALADALTRLVADEELRQELAAAARTRSAMFDVAAATREIESIYRRLGPVTPVVRAGAPRAAG
jgi:glycosyltransferase involved in cell wall biosynthesis